MSKLEASTKTFLVTNSADRRFLGNGYSRVTINYDYMGYPVSFECTSEKSPEIWYEDHPEEVERVARRFDKDFKSYWDKLPSAKH